MTGRNAPTACRTCCPPEPRPGGHNGTGPSAAAVGLDSGAWGYRTWCSWHDSGWRSLIVRDLISRPVVHDVVVPATDEQVLVLITRGAKRIESRSGGRSRSAEYGPGTVALTAPGRKGRFNWRCHDGTGQEAIHVHLPTAALEAAAGAVWEAEEAAHRMPDALATEDPVLQAVLPALDRAARTGADDLYAQPAAVFLAVHLLAVHGEAGPPTRVDRSRQRMQDVEDYMREHLAAPLTLADLAGIAHLSEYHFARTFRDAIGSPPRQRLTELRLERALRMLRRTDLTIAEIAAASGFQTTARLTAAVRRAHGTTPTAVRADARS